MIIVSLCVQNVDIFPDFNYVLCMCVPLFREDRFSVTASGRAAFCSGLPCQSSIPGVPVYPVYSSPFSSHAFPWTVRVKTQNCILFGCGNVLLQNINILTAFDKKRLLPWATWTYSHACRQGICTVFTGMFLCHIISLKWTVKVGNYHSKCMVF